MRYIEELSPREIAAILGISESAASVRIHRAMARMKVLINNGKGG
jgi:DNA-directed RNA polymerase specialized sigma24 family protein